MKRGQTWTAYREAQAQQPLLNLEPAPVEPPSRHRVPSAHDSDAGAAPSTLTPKAPRSAAGDATGTSPLATEGSSGQVTAAVASPASASVTPASPSTVTPPASSDPEERAPSDAAGKVAVPAGPRSIAARIVHLAQQMALSDAEVGELDTLLGREINTASTLQMRKFLYEQCGFPKRYIKEGNRSTTRLSVDVSSLLATYRQNRDRRLELCLLLSDRRTQLEALGTKLDRDGRIRFSLNIAGTKVGRMSCQASNTGSGFNMTTVNERHKCLFPADAGCDFYSADLKTADGWTIGAECAALGDSRMLDDMRAGLKPANAVLLLWTHGPQVNQWPMERCLEAQAGIDKKDWRYAACKSGVWGTCYGEGDVTLSVNILEESWKGGGQLVYVSAADCKRLQAAVHARYPGIRRRMERINMLLARDGKLTPCEGVPPRDFFGPKTDHQVQKAGYAYAPAFVTAYADHLALLKMWNDPENIDASGQRIARPRLPVHDSITFVAPVERREWVAERVPLWFANPVCVAGTTFTIPVECCRGANWGDVVPI